MFLTFIRTKSPNDLDGAGDGTAIHGQSRVAGVEIFGGRRGNGGGKTHSTHLLRKLQDVETGLQVGIKGLVKGFGDLDFIFFGVKLQPDSIPVDVRWKKLLKGNFFGQLERVFIDGSVKIFEKFKAVELLQSPAFQTA